MSRGAVFYRDLLADDAVLVVPGMVVERSVFLDAMAGEQPWARHEIDEARVVELSTNGESAALVYHVAARREGQPEYRALVTTVYVRRSGRWQLALHQQTPEPS